MASSLELKKNCLDAFGDQTILGYNPSLSDYYFAENFHCLPFEMLIKNDFSGNNQEMWRRVRSFCETEVEIIRRHIDFHDIERMIVLGVRPYRDEAYTEIPAGYMYAFCDSIAFLNGDSFLFYLAVVIYQVAQGNAEELNLSLEYFLFHLNKGEEFRALLNLKQKKAVAYMMECLIQADPDDINDLEAEFNIYWSRFLAA